MNKTPTPDDLRVFAMVARKAGFAATARELGSSVAYVSKRLQVLETQLGTRLLHRSTRRVTVTEDGERVLAWAMRLLADVDGLMEELTSARESPRGLLRVSSSFGFGRRMVAPALARLSALHPALEVRLEVFDRLLDVAGEGFDLDVRVGDDIAPQFIARRLAANHRVLCAAPAYLRRRGKPRSLADLGNHDCLAIRERDHPFGLWRLQQAGSTQALRVAGAMSTNDGEIAVQWALEGRGIVLRSVWHVGPLIRTGALERVLPNCSQEANIWAVHPTRLAQSAKVRACVGVLEQAFAALDTGE